MFYALFHDMLLVVINISINHFNNLFIYGIRERMNYNNNYDYYYYLVILGISNKISYWRKSSVMLFLKATNFMEFYI